MADRPKFENAPGLKLRQLGDQWEARWRPREDLIKRGYPGTPQRLWKGTEPTETERQWVSDRCNALQAEMLVWGRGGLPQMSPFDGTLASLIRCYETDPDSTVHKMRYKSRLVSARLCKVLMQEHGDVLMSEIKGRQVKRWHDEWTKRGVAMAHALVGKLRTVIGFGASLLEDEDCERLCGVLHHMRFEMPKPRTERLTADQANAIRRKAHAMGYHSVALAQALQFECMFRQKDIIGEWVPKSEPGVTDIMRGGYKWLRGVRWSEISDGLILRHMTSKRQKEISIDLRFSPMVMEELANLGERPTSGPIIICEATGYPWESSYFRVIWRKIANEAKVPKEVKNMDTRAGAISEATDAGSPLEHVRHAATHSDTAMTEKYSRGSEEKVAEVQRRRIEHRNRKRTSGSENGE